MKKAQIIDAISREDRDTDLPVIEENGWQVLVKKDLFGCYVVHAASKTSTFRVTLAASVAIETKAQAKRDVAALIAHILKFRNPDLDR